jgi:hypothetical protein
MCAQGVTVRSPLELDTWLPCHVMHPISGATGIVRVGLAANRVQ